MNNVSKIAASAVVVISIIGGGVAYAGKKHGDDEDHAKHAEYAVTFVAKKLDLDATQEQALSAVKDQLLFAKQSMKAQMETTHDDVRALVSAETFDQAKALEMINTKTATVNSVAPELVGAIGNFMDTLDAEQKEEILEFMEKRGGKHKRGHWRH